MTTVIVLAGGIGSNPTMEYPEYDTTCHICDGTCGECVLTDDKQRYYDSALLAHKE